jgi:outer membrane beta-barrel protein
VRVLATALALGTAGAGRASEADAFENRVPPISGQLYPKAHRLEITPTVNLSLNDAFYSKTFFGAKLDYHLAESWAVGASFAFGSASPTGSTNVCSVNKGCEQASPDKLYQVPGKVKALGGVQLAWAPVYGKLGVLAELPVHFDLSLMGGPDWVSYQEVLDSTAAGAGQVPGTKSTIGGHLGLGMRLFFAGFMAIRLDFKDYLYSATVGNQGSKLQNQLFLEMGVSIFFPTSRGASP